MIVDAHDIPLLPLRSVLFPDGLLSLRVSEARYIDLITRSLETSEEFGVVLILDSIEGAEREPGQDLATVGCMARVLDCDMRADGFVHVRCKGGSRFFLHSHEPAALGLETGRAQTMPEDPHSVVDARHAAAALALGRAIAALSAQGRKPFLPPYRLDSPGWVANRWAEILPIGELARLRLMELPDGSERLDVVVRYLRQHGIVDASHSLQ